jgi:hypothetical protein
VGPGCSGRRDAAVVTSFGGYALLSPNRQRPVALDAEKRDEIVFYVGRFRHVGLVFRLVTTAPTGKIAPTSGFTPCLLYR